MEEELGVSSGGKLYVPVGGDSSFVERDQILDLESSALEFHAVSQQDCRLFMLQWFGYYSKM